jgi:hypothetical protein
MKVHEDQQPIPAAREEALKSPKEVINYQA